MVLLRFRLDFRWEGRMCGLLKPKGEPMVIKDSQAVLATLIDLIHERLADAAETAKAAKACAGVGNIDEAIRITLSIDEPLYEATTLSNSAALIKRLSQRDD